MANDLRNTRVLIVGAARQGLALARYMLSQGAHVTLNDNRTSSELTEIIAAFSGPNIRWVTGGHPVELAAQTDLVCPSGGIPLEIDLLQAARVRGLRFSNDSQVFLEACPAPVIGLTGSAGKTTTTTLVGRMASAAVQLGDISNSFVGGNIGNPLIDDLGEIESEDLVVMELSSFQLDIMTSSPDIAVILNLTPNHLDRHKTFDNYRAAKARVLEFQTADQIAVLGWDDPAAWDLRAQVRGRLAGFGWQAPVLQPDDLPVNPMVYLRADKLILSDNGEAQDIMAVSEVELRGRHNLLNVLAACAIAAAAGLSIDAMRAGTRGFRGVPHRLAFVREYQGSAWYNDSIATAPERAVAGLESFEEPLVLLAGGRDKDLSWDVLVEAIVDRVDHLIAFGETAAMLTAGVRAHAPAGPQTVHECAGLAAAVQTAAQLARPGSVVLLSPGGTSFDEFHDFVERGERFEQWTLALN
jgi:UDP-N-acetylmuramoylalanine--D-glutamate ligase